MGTTATATRRQAPRKARNAPAAQSADRVEWRNMLDVALTMPGSVGSTYCRFYSYSYPNQVLLMMQGARGPVATYKSWGELHRQVRKGEKAKAILRPITVKVEDKETGETTRRAIARFTMVRCIFDVGQTDGDELPPFVLPEWSADRALSALEITRRPFDLLDGNVQGYASKRSVAINPVAVHPMKTTLHEIGHVVLGHTTQGEADSSPRGTQEFQAEATALLAGKELGVIGEAAESSARAYIQGWLAGATPTEKQIREVFSAVDKIVKAGRPELAS